GPSWPPLERVELFAGLEHLAERRRDARKVRLPSLRQAHASRRSMQQANAESRLEEADGLTQGGRRNLELRSGGSEAAVLGDLTERQQPVELVELHIVKHTFTRHPALRPV